MKEVNWKGIQQAFEARPRAKRLLRAKDGDLGEILSEIEALSSTNWSKASRTLHFSLAKVSSTTYASPYCSQPLLTSSGANLLGLVRSVLSPIKQVRPNYHASRHVEKTQEFRPSFTSTLSCLLRNLKENQQVRLSVQYPSKSLSKWLHGTYQNISKAQAHGIRSRMPTAVKNCPADEKL